MTEFQAEIDAILRFGLDARLFSAAAAGVRTREERILTAVGTSTFDDQQPVAASSLFDLASLTKTYTAAATMALVDRGVLDLESPVIEYLPVGVGMSAERITLRMLLRHTSGLPAISEIWRDPSVVPIDRLAHVLASDLVAEPDRNFTYSCLGFIAVGALIEVATGVPLSQSLSNEIFAPLGLENTSFGPVSASRSVATEYEPYIGRGLVHGEVHDELSWYLGGRTGNAGLFASVNDVLRFAESFLAPTLLSERALQTMTRSSLPPNLGVPFGHGLGVRIGDMASMGTSRGFGHTGFTGTMWIANPDGGWAVVLLTNRVHPHREAVKIAPFRRMFMDRVQGFLDLDQRLRH